MGGRDAGSMSDVVVQLPIQAGEEAQLFGAYLAEFMESCCDEADRFDDESDAPFLMIRSDPLQDVDFKVLTFQQPSAAQAFCVGWAQARRRSVG
jgi:hypothetical protein